MQGNNLVQCGICSDESGFSEVYCDTVNSDIICNFGGSMGPQIAGGIQNISAVIPTPDVESMQAQQMVLLGNSNIKALVFIKAGMVVIYETHAEVYGVEVSKGAVATYPIEWYEFTGNIN